MNVTNDTNKVLSQLMMLFEIVQSYAAQDTTGCLITYIRTLKETYEKTKTRVKHTQLIMLTLFPILSLIILLKKQSSNVVSK